MAVFFISDLHLHPSRPHTIEQLCRFLKILSQDPGHRLFLMGDFFDAWIGDDDPEPEWLRVKQALKALSAAGVEISWMAGNRDFLVGSRFMQEAGCIPLEDPSCVTLGEGLRVVLTHGDILCTEDKAYQRFRRVVRKGWVQSLYLALPLRWRVSIARRLRAESRSKRTAEQASGWREASYQTWVDSALVARLLVEHDAQVLIHGHTHEPGVHEVGLGGTKAQRIVLGEWKAEPSILVFSDGVFKFGDFVGIV